MHPMRREDFLKEAVRHIDVSSKMTVGDLVSFFNNTSFQSRALARCFNSYVNMLKDPDRPTIYLGLAGAMVPGGMRRVMRDMIEYNMVDVVVSTGANLYHDFIEAMGIRHYIGSPDVGDVELRELRIDRVYDTFLDDRALTAMDNLIKEMSDRLEPRVYSSREYLSFIGRNIKDEGSILYTAAKHGVPIFCPALCDSSFGIALTKQYKECRDVGRKTMIIDQIRDVYEFMQIKEKSKKTGAIYIGGGVPKNYIQQLEVLFDVLGIKIEGHKYVIQITTDDPKFGGLSGATFEEAQSWGKVTSEACKAVAYIDATIGLPLLVGAIIEKCLDLLKRRGRLSFKWEGELLKEMKVSFEQN